MTLVIPPSLASVRYPPAIEAEIQHLVTRIQTIPILEQRYRPRWLAIQLLEGDKTLLAEFDPVATAPLEAALVESRDRLQDQYGEDIDIAITDERYHFVHELVDDVLTRPAGHHLTRSDRIDRILTHQWLGIPILLALMYLVFNLVQTVSAPYLDWVDTVMSGPVSQWAASFLALVHAPSWLTSLLVDGVIAGVGGVLVFLPGLLVMYFSLAFLEASGYMARAAFVMDRAMNVLGLQGQSFVPMILGFGCNVPAIYATRAIENRAARVLTGLLIPFMSCSARLPVYVIFGLAFFPRRANVVIWGLYVLGIVVAALVGIVLSRTIFRKSSPETFIMEMPPYRMPTFRELWTYTRIQSSAFVRKAGTFILVISVLFWILINLPWGVENPRDSYFGKVSQAVSPVFEPAGFGEWESTGALMTGILAKEAVVSSLSQIYVGEAGETAEPAGFAENAQTIVVGFAGATLDAGKQLLETLTPGFTLFDRAGASQDTALTVALQQAFTPLAALAFLAFVLLYVPCMATMGALVQELGWRWAGLSLLLTLLVPWTVAVAIYQGGRLFGLG
mgnify:CR=1 FL=1